MVAAMVVAMVALMTAAMVAAMAAVVAAAMLHIWPACAHLFDSLGHKMGEEERGALLDGRVHCLRNFCLQLIYDGTVVERASCITRTFSCALYFSLEEERDEAERFE